LDYIIIKYNNIFLFKQYDILRSEAVSDRNVYIQNIFIQPVNDPPVIIKNNTELICEEDLCQKSLNFFFSVSDIDANDELTVSLFALRGRFEFIKSKAIGVKVLDDTFPNSKSIQGNMQNLNNFIPYISYISNENYFGPDAITVQVRLF
jgi:hypothetical protein